MNRRLTDALLVLLLLLVTALLALRYVDHGVLPHEDAAMLMRYAAHLAQGDGIVWNVGEPPVDGATDFLFMVAVALVNRIGLPLAMSARGLGVLSHLLTVAIIYVAVRNIHGSGVLPAALSALYFAIGPGLFLAAAHFGTPFFVLAVAATWILALKIIFGSRSTLHYAAFSLAGLITGLIRPEGVLIAVFMLIAVCLMIGPRRSGRLAICFASIFLLIGGVYFLWRWSYFGHPLPNPFYKKGGGHLYPGALRVSIFNTFGLCYAFIPAFVLAARTKRALRLALCFAIPIAGSTAMWVLLSGEMNIGGRFQYPVFAVAVLSWYPLVAGVRKDLNLPAMRELGARSRLAVLAASLAVVAGLFTARLGASGGITHSRDGRYDVGVMLSDYADRDYTIATTEAGLLPLYSKWRAVDTWGLNDSWIAHSGAVTEQYLDTRGPDVIVWHGYFSPMAAPSAAQPEGSWSHMVMTLKSYAEKNDYVLAAVFGVSPFDTHYYYVSRKIPECDEIVSRIRSTRYAWWENGRECVNYALFAPVGQAAGRAAATGTIDAGVTR